MKITHFPTGAPQQPYPKDKPSFGIKYSTKAWKNWDGYDTIRDTVELSNGKKLIIHKEYQYGRIDTKLLYLVDELGRWVKSKLIDYKSNTTIKSFNKNI